MKSDITRIVGLVLLFVVVLSPWGSVRADNTAWTPFTPCFTQELTPVKMLPSTMPIIMVLGHQFRKGDKCVPVTVTYTWTNHYDLKDGYSYYNLRYSQKFSGELWYRTDREEFTITANPAHWAGYDKIRGFDGAGQRCVRFDEAGLCEELRKYERGQAYAKTTGGVYLGSLTYGYPEVVTNGETVPVTFFAQSTLFEFRNTKYTWRPDGGTIEINNPALIHFDYKKLVEAAADEKVYTISVPYKNDNDTGDIPSPNAGELTIKLDFDLACDGSNDTGMSKCEQIEGLLSELKWALELRDIYRDVWPLAPDSNTLLALVMVQIRMNHRYMTDDDANFIQKNFGATNPVDLSISVPDLCNDCTARPLCQWRTEAIRVHEQTHRSYFLQNPHDRAVMAEDRSVLANVNNLGPEQARIEAQMEYRAYNERAKFLLNLLSDQLAENPDCPFWTGGFGEDLNALSDRIDKTVTLQAPQP